MVEQETASYARKCVVERARNAALKDDRFSFGIEHTIWKYRCAPSNLQLRARIVPHLKLVILLKYQTRKKRLFLAYASYFQRWLHTRTSWAVTWLTSGWWKRCAHWTTHNAPRDPYQEPKEFFFSVHASWDGLCPRSFCFYPFTRALLSDALSAAYSCFQ